jgi:hypothetical protein
MKLPDVHTESAAFRYCSALIALVHNVIPDPISDNSALLEDSNVDADPAQGQSRNQPSNSAPYNQHPAIVSHSAVSIYCSASSRNVSILSPTTRVSISLVADKSSRRPTRLCSVTKDIRIATLAEQLRQVMGMGHQ